MSEECLIRNCSPTLAGIKTGNLFACKYGSVREINGEIAEYNRRLGGKGLRIVPLSYKDGRALVYVYRPSYLRQDLCQADAMKLLRRLGYGSAQADECLVELIARLKRGEGFPHEIGLFLGYPPEDVKGFIDNVAQEYKYSGYWKVYGDEEGAKKRFQQYKKCTDVYVKSLRGGNTLERLTVRCK